MSNDNGLEPSINLYHFLIDGKPSGPHSAAEIERLIEAAKVSQSTPVWRSGMEGWRPAGTASELVRVFPQLLETPPPMPPFAGEALALKWTVRGEPRTATQIHANEVKSPSVFEIVLPELGSMQRISMSDVRDSREDVYLAIIWIANVIVGMILL